MFRERPQARVGVGAAIFTEFGDGKVVVLLGKRKGSRGAGEWAFPGGHVEYMEPLTAAVVREIEEETGLKFKEEDFHFTAVSEDMFEDYGKHYVTVYFHTLMPPMWPASVSVEVKEPEFCEEWKWWPVNDLPEPLWYGVKGSIRTVFDQHGFASEEEFSVRDYMIGQIFYAIDNDIQL